MTTITTPTDQAAAICKQCGYAIIIGKAPALYQGGRVRVRVSCFCGDLCLDQDADLTPYKPAPPE
jgi:hypothetical protein